MLLLSAACRINRRRSSTNKYTLHNMRARTDATACIISTHTILGLLKMTIIMRVIGIVLVNFGDLSIVSYDAHKYFGLLLPTNQNMVWFVATNLACPSYGGGHLMGSPRRSKSDSIVWREEGPTPSKYKIRVNLC